MSINHRKGSTVFFIAKIVAQIDNLSYQVSMKLNMTLRRVRALKV